MPRSRRPTLEARPIAWLLALLFVAAVGMARPSEGPLAPSMTIEIPVEKLAFSHLQGYDLVSLEGGGYLTDPGHPMLPAEQIRIALPAGWGATGVRVLGMRSIDLPGVYTILPAQPPVPTASDGVAAFVPPDAAIYGSSAPYPREVVRLLRQTDLAGQGMAVLEVTPVQFAPAEGRLVFATSITVTIDGAPGYVCGDYLPATASAGTRAAYTQQVREMVLNPEAVQLATGGSPLLGGRALEAGDYDYVIIAPAGFVANYEPLAEWKTKKGVPTRIVTTAWIYNQGGYTGSNEEKIRAFIADAHATWGAVYFLLGGDTSQIPVQWWPTTIEPYNIPNDTYYADIDDDWVVEVHVGRAPARYAPEVYTFVAKILGYEKTPPRTDFATRTLLLGFNLDDLSFGQEEKEYIANQYFPGGLDLTRVYDSYAGNHKTATIAAINAGQSFINHIDHCTSIEMGVGSLMHGWAINIADVNALSNGDRQSVWYTTGCFPAAFDENTCIAEAYVKRVGGGGHAFVGNTRYGWYNPGILHTLSNRYDDEFFRALWVGGQSGLGDCFSAHKNSFFPYDESYRYIFRELTLLGDPELPLWTADPESLVVAHAGTMPVGCRAFSVHVATLGGAPVSGARVCLWKEGDVYLTALSGGNGNATFDPNPASEGVMWVTMTRHNDLPYEGQISVTTGGADVTPEVVAVAAPRLLPAQPSPFAFATTLAYELPRPAAVALRIFDLSGRRVRTLLRETSTAAGSHRVVWDGQDDAGRPVAAGVYLCRLDVGEERFTSHLIRVR